MRIAFFLALVLATLCVVPPSAAAQTQQARTEFEKRRLEWLIECGQRHLEYGVELRKQGLALQAAEQIRLAVEASERRNAAATTVLGYMQRLDEHFWKKRAPKPSAAKLEAYVKRARRLEIDDQRGQLALASWGHARGLEEEARREYLSLLRKRDRPLEFDGRGAIVVDGGTIPAKAAARIRDEAIAINGEPWLRDAFLELVPELKSIFEAGDDDLRIRSTHGREQAQHLLSIARQLLPALEADLGARPTRPLPVVVVDTRALYERWLDAADLGDHKVVTGVATPRYGLAILCSEGLSESQLVGILLHELTHVFDQATSRVALPSWYHEGLAEVHGGDGTWALVEGKLTTGGRFDVGRLSRLCVAENFTALPDLLDWKGIELWKVGRERGLDFYAQSWAFLTFLRTGAGKDVAERMEAWETQIRGAMIGADLAAANARSGAPASARDLFLEVFGAELPRLEDRFRSWVRETVER